MNVKLSASQRQKHLLEQPQWSSYRLPQQPSIPGGLGWDGPWNEPIDGSSRYKVIENDERPVRAGTLWKPGTDGITHATPFNIKTGATPYRKVYSYKVQYPDNAFLEALNALFGVGRERHSLPIVGTSQLPYVEGHPTDPPTYGDRHYIIVDLERRKLFECLSTRKGTDPTNWWGGQCWWFDSVSEWDLNIPYADQASKYLGANAARVPMLPVIAKYEEFQKGVIDHAIGVALPNSQKGFVYPAMNTDGRGPGWIEEPVDVVMGQRMRLKREYVVTQTGFARTLAEALNHYGMIVTDSTGMGHASLWVAPDGRYEGENIEDFRPPMSAFEIIEP